MDTLKSPTITTLPTPCPTLGRFLQIDPVYGGSCNNYDYNCQKPLGSPDIDGDLCGFVCVYNEINEAGNKIASKVGHWITSGFTGKVLADCTSVPLPFDASTLCGAVRAMAMHYSMTIKMQHFLRFRRSSGKGWPRLLRAE